MSVYTPSLPSEAQKLLPVLVWIHGGGYYVGSGNADTQGPNRIMDYGVVRYYILSKSKIRGIIMSRS
jgi:carboxylesterase type B